MRASSLLVSFLAILPLGAAVPSSLGKPGTGLVLLTDDSKLLMLSDNAPTLISPPMPVTGVTAGDSLLAIDMRPQNQGLYALGVNTASDTVRLYHVSSTTGFASPLGSPAILATPGGSTIQLDSLRFDIDLNPQADRLRVVASSGLNFRMNPNTGDCIDSDANASNGITPDGSINGLTTSVDGAAYTNNVPNTVITTLYTLDSVTNSLHIQNPPNNGTQTTEVKIKVGGILHDFSTTHGFDIPVGVNAPSMNTAASGAAYAVLESGTRRLYRINLSDGEATLLTVPAGVNIVSLAVRTQMPAAIALDAGGFLVRFRTDAPGTLTTLATGSPSSGETLVGIDYRPATGQLYGLGIDSANNDGTLYLVDPQTGGLTAIGTPGQIAFTNEAATTIPLPPASDGYGFDFNPQLDRLRVTSGGAGGPGINFRVNPNTGAPVDGNLGLASPPAGTNPDGAINGAASGVTGCAYANSYGSFPSTQPTSLYTLDPATNSLYLQVPPNLGTQTSGKLVRRNGATLDFTAVSGFDITAEGGTTAGDNLPSNGHGWASLTVGGTNSLYRIDLRTGDAVSAGAIGVGTGVLVGLAVAGEDGAGFAPLTWASVASSSYRIETSTDLTNWKPYGIAVIANGATTSVPVPWYGGEKKRFWRVVLP
ncbi:DUF4394 domain-containing protein [Luteolibacter luteus]|uniref:DUF4394 domain-containing protein n=1 Tax=Luteolibacter luteus TaxID=2728835 RepID=A0A858RK52_9BACT|nr:DUF4394 domain-containing protein [Luteolibacter luteus]QJE96580.1 DUF4394 domain-containing protein [Luteolibacter luteus]